MVQQLWSASLIVLAVLGGALQLCSSYQPDAISSGTSCRRDHRDSSGSLQVGSLGHQACHCVTQRLNQCQKEEKVKCIERAMFETMRTLVMCRVCSRESALLQREQMSRCRGMWSEGRSLYASSSTRWHQSTGEAWRRGCGALGCSGAGWNATTVPHSTPQTSACSISMTQT